MKLDREVGLGLGHIMSDGTQLSLPKGNVSPHQFSAHVCYGQTAGWIKMPLGIGVGLDTIDIVLDGDPAPPLKRGTTAQFSAHVYCGQTVAHLSYC